MRVHALLTDHSPPLQSVASCRHAAQQMGCFTTGNPLNSYSSKHEVHQQLHISDFCTGKLVGVLLLCSPARRASGPPGPLNRCWMAGHPHCCHWLAPQELPATLPAVGGGPGEYVPADVHPAAQQRTMTFSFLTACSTHTSESSADQCCLIPGCLFTLLGFTTHTSESKVPILKSKQLHYLPNGNAIASLTFCKLSNVLTHHTHLRKNWIITPSSSQHNCGTTHSDCTKLLKSS
jgi:hypothetical protein